MADTPDREALERRIAELERSVQRLMRVTGLQRDPETAMLLPPKQPPAPPRMIDASDLARAPAPAPRSLQVPSKQQQDFDLEQWVGGRGLLLVGVIALLAASGFFLKYAFDRGWVAPWLRVGGALIAGALVLAFGERQIRAGLRPFGLALAGAGGGLLYLGIWAAAGPYAMVSRQIGIIAIALAAALLAWRAAHHNAEALALWALLGAYTAPLVLPTPDTRPEAFLAYVGVASVFAFALSHALGWRLTFAVALVGYFLFAPTLVTDSMHEGYGPLYLALGGSAAVRIAQEREWPEARVGAVALPWILLMIHAGQIESRQTQLAALAGAAALLLMSWFYDRANERFWSRELYIEMDEYGVPFLLVPVAFVIVVARTVSGDPFIPVAATALAAVLYLATGWRGRCAPQVAVGFGLLAIALMQLWAAPALVGVWSLLLALYIVADRHLDQRAGPGMAMLLGLATAVLLFGGLTIERGDFNPAFTGSWALAWYAFVAAGAAAALLWRRREELPRWSENGQPILWGMTGIMLLIAGSLEIQRFFDQREVQWANARLMGDLGISVFWLAYAGGLVAAGFRLGNATVRSAGLMVAAMAVLKIALYDLSRLEALYRVGSFFVLALIALAVAYGYSRAAKRAGVEGLRT